MKVAEAESPVVPVTVMLYVPGMALVATWNPVSVNDSGSTPVELMVHVAVAPTMIGEDGD
jgi:hypothetical protein